MKAGNKELLILGGCAAAAGVLALLFLRRTTPNVYGVGATGLPAATAPVSTGPLPNGGVPGVSYGAGPTVNISNPWGSGNPWSWTNPGFPDPITIPAPAPLSINLSGSTFSGIAPYMPLFGFVGVDTTQSYQ